MRTAKLKNPICYLLKGQEVEIVGERLATVNGSVKKVYITHFPGATENNEHYEESLDFEP